ncbi:MULTISPECIES: hypothetical protein [Butyricimonas]|uniref:hypothetical protein n=1 Tax=Butyricimonas TaxID=574697 RepID=UPI001D072EC8|nr:MULTISPECIES: hypothetical protein [Butyricimonas]MCB6971828.1 hypothetical protein [Butyricimonas synergistica]MCG4518836.1 hypothetical protein [Butyricimonas sp. DFI.6.44]
MKEKETKEPEKDDITPVEQHETSKIKEKETKTKEEILIEQYAKAYPKEKLFHVTSDMQVFLAKDKNLAELHQRGLENEEKIRTIKVK